MADRVKGITVQIGGDTTGLSKALSGVNKQINSTQAELRDVERLLKFDPTNTVLLKQKQELLAKAVSDTEGKLETLKKANEQAAESVKNYDAWKTVYDPIQQEIEDTQKQLGELKDAQKEAFEVHGEGSEEYEKLQEAVAETSNRLKELKQQAKNVTEEFGKPISQSQYDALQREIVATEIGLTDLKTQAVKTENAINGIDNESLEAVADAADKAEEQLEQAGKEASNFGDYLKAEVIVEGAKAIMSSLKDVAEESKEYMKIMGSLEVSSEKAGYSAKQTEEVYKNLYGVLADEQSAATTTANLQAIHLEQEKLIQITNATIGAWATYGDSIPIDGLAEAINHTSQLGEVQGTLSDVLEWAGVSVDDFNAQLAECSTAEERADFILQQLVSQGLTDAGEAWKQNNQALVENNLANAEMQEQMAQLGETVMPVITQITQVVAMALEKFNGLDEGTQKVILSVVALVAVLGPVISTVGSMTGSISGLSSVFGTITGKVLPALSSSFSTIFGFIAANPIVLLIGAIVALVALIATKGDEIQDILQKVDDFLQNVFASDWSEVLGPVLGSPLNVFFDNVKGIWDAIKLIFEGIIEFIQGVFSGNWEQAWQGVEKIFSGIFSGLTAIAKAPINGIIGLLNSAVSAVNQLINGFNSIGFDMPDWLGGGSWHPNIPTIPSIPLLAKGGILTEGYAIVGEAGPEILTLSGNRAVVQPLTGSAATGKGLSDVLGVLNAYLPYLAASRSVVLDSGELVGALTPQIDMELGRLAALEGGR